MTTKTTQKAADVKSHLDLLFQERALALAAGLGNDAAYMTDLDDEIATCRAAYTGAAVTEIAIFRSLVSGPQVG